MCRACNNITFKTAVPYVLHPLPPASFPCRYMYFATGGPGVGQIERAKLDGSSRAREVLHSTDLLIPYDVAIDYDNSLLFWVDQQINKIEQSNLDGTNRQLVYDLQDGASPFGVTLFKESLYWSEQGPKQIVTGSSKPNSPTPVGTPIIDVSGDLRRLKTVAESRQPGKDILFAFFC